MFIVNSYVRVFDERDVPPDLDALEPGEVNPFLVDEDADAIGERAVMRHFGVGSWLTSLTPRFGTSKLLD